MRLREFFTKLNEDSTGAYDASDDSSSGGQATQGDTKKRSSGTRGSVHPHHSSAIKGMQTIPDWPGIYYKMYRLGVHLAGSPDNPPDHEGAFSNEMMFTTYTEEEQDMLNHSAKEMGVKLKALSSNKSREPEETNTTSPINKPKRNKYGV